MERNADLEAKIIADPSNADAYLVYADWLQSKGDPRGELITLHHGGKTAEANAFIKEHADELLGDVLKNYVKTFDGDEEDAFEWHLGFIRKARFSYDSNSAGDVEVDDEDHDIALETGLAALLQHPSGMFLQELVVPINMQDDGAYFEPIIKTIAEHKAPALRKLRLGEFSCSGGPGGTGNYEYEISWTGIGDASALWKAVPNLEDLVIQSGLGSTSASSESSDSFGTIDLPKLKRLEIITGGMSLDIVKSIANANWPELRHMDIWFGSESYGAAGGVDDIEPILEGTKLPKLEHLGLMNAEFTNDICSRIATAKILPRLKELSLAYGTMTDEGAQSLVGREGAFRHLTTLAVHHNCLSSEGTQMLKTLCKSVPSDDQKGDGESDRYVSLSE